MSSSSGITQQINGLVSLFDRCMADINAADNQNDVISHLRTVSLLFTQVCTIAEHCAISREQTQQTSEKIVKKCASLQSRASAFDDVLQQLHVLLSSKYCGDEKSANIYYGMVDEVRDNMRAIRQYHRGMAKYQVEVARNMEMSNYIDRLSQVVVMQKAGMSFYAKEVAANRQLMDLVRKTSSVEMATASKVWDEIHMETETMRMNTMWLINRINSADMLGAPYEEEGGLTTAPRLVILMRTQAHKDLGLEITGGSDKFRPIIVSGRLRGSMADTSELHIGDRILMIDGSFVTNTTTHAQVMKMLEDESTKDYLTLVVAKYDPWIVKDNEKEDC